MRHGWLIAMGSLLAAAAPLGCGGGELWSTGCLSDADCKHGRVCVEGVCQDPATACTSDADCPAGSACLAGVCVACDVDRDGAAALACGGADCDDENAGVRPGAAELCGDGLDNDCDGNTDPPSLCDDLCATVLCSEGYACDPATGACVPICTPDCAGRACGPDGCGGECGSCAPGERCTADGRCQQTCRDECAAGARRCAPDDPGAYQVCQDWDDDPCLEWSPPQRCPDNLICDASTGQCGGCTPDCDGRECGPDPVCGTSCGVCSANEICTAQGRCVPGCTDGCDGWGQTACLADGQYTECGDWDGDPCLEWSEGRPCPDGQACDPASGSCGGACVDECPWGLTTCWDDYAEATCEDWDGDGCAEWGEPRPCPEGYCDYSTGRCGGCWDECEWGQTGCWDERSQSFCEDWDGDGCAEWGEPMPCPEGMACDWSTGSCYASCVDACSFGQVRCLSPRRYLVCGEYDGDPCTEWSPTEERCPAGTTCSVQAGGCTGGGCQDECVMGERYCVDAWTWIECGNHDTDPCLEFGPPLPCPPDMPCDWNTGTCGGCQPLTCWELGVECGQWDDGCGALIDCGSCASGEICADGVCTASGVFGTPCAEQEECQSGLTCTRVDDAHLGYCNRTCSAADPCPSPFQCYSVAGSNWCVTLCGSASSCAVLGAWECVWFTGVPTGVCLPSLATP